MAETKKRILFLCTGNVARSQMAEGLMRAFHGDEWEVFSAGSRPGHGPHPQAIRAMAAIGIDIRDHYSKPASYYLDTPFDIVVTVCDSAARDCPRWSGAKRIEHWPIPDPTTPETFDAIRDDLARRIEELLATL
jgi:arsenate reductase (thioredoxin)